MSQINVDTVRNRTSTNGGPTFDKGLTVSAGTTAYVYGNLQVDGTETIVNTERLDVADKTVGIASTTAASNSTADGAGIEVYGGAGGNKTITWVNSTSNWTLGGGGLTADSAIVGSAVTINGSGIKAGIITANSFGAVSATTGSFSGDVDIADTIVHTGDTNTKIRFPAADTITAETAGSERLRIDSSGNVGINTTNPNHELTVFGDEVNFRLTHSGSTNKYNALYTNVNGTGVEFNSYQDGTGTRRPFAFKQYTTEVLSITNAGDVGISSAIPSSLLDVRGSMSVGPGIVAENLYTVASALTGTVNFDVVTNGLVQYHTTNSSGTFIVNLRGDGSTTLNSLLRIGQTTVFTLYSAQNNASYYMTDFKIDGSSQTEKWNGGSAPSAGTASGVDVYTFNIMKTANATFTVFATFSNFA